MEKNFLFKFRKLLNSFQHRVFTRAQRNTEEHFLHIRWRWSEEPKGSYAERLRDLLRRMAL